MDTEAYKSNKIAFDMNDVRVNGSDMSMIYQFWDIVWVNTEDGGNELW